jgi:hypothetical protein
MAQSARTTVQRVAIPAEDLPFIDEHGVPIDAPSDAVWSALVDVVQGIGGHQSGLFARVLGADPAIRSSASIGTGSAIPGFRMTTVDKPRVLAMRGRHRFSDYSLTFRLNDDAGKTYLTAETRAAFPRPLGALYRAAVIESHAHRLLLRRLLSQVRRRATT